MTRTFLWTFAALCAVAAVSAACPVVVDERSMAAFVASIDSINADLQACPTPIPGLFKFMLGNKNTQLQVAMRDGSTSTFTMAISGGELAGIQKGGTATGYVVVTDEASMDLFFASNDRLGTLLALYRAKKVRVQAASFSTRVKFFVAKPVLSWFSRKSAASLPSAPVAGTPPDYCDETSLPGHRGYAENKALWDSYSADSTGVCQMQRNRYPSGCRHSVQLSVSGTPYYLCWY